MKAILIGLVFIAGCLTNETEDEQQATLPSTQLRSGQQIFEADVFPILVVTCGGCHTGAQGAALGFSITDATSTYKAVVANKLLVGDFTPAHAAIFHIERISGHVGLRFDTTNIIAWLDQEHRERQ